MGKAIEDISKMKELSQIRNLADKYLIEEFCKRRTDQLSNVDVIYRYALNAYIRGYREARRKYKRKLKKMENRKTLL